MQRGDTWFAATPGGDRPVLVLTRDPVAARIGPSWLRRSPVPDGIVLPLCLCYGAKTARATILGMIIVPGPLYVDEAESYGFRSRRLRKPGCRWSFSKSSGQRARIDSAGSGSTRRSMRKPAR